MKKQYLLIFVMLCLAMCSAKAQCSLGISISSVVNISCNGSNGSIIANSATGGASIPIITTIAGNGYYSYSGDGGAASLAELHSPEGVTLDDSGNIYIADYFNYVIRKISTSGIISTVAGNRIEGYSGDGGAATLAELRKPAGVAVDVEGNIYIADDTNNRIRKVNTSGIISTIAGNGSPGSSGDGGAATLAELRFPSGIALDKSGNIYIADFDNNKVRRVSTSGVISTVAGIGNGGYNGDEIAATSAELSYPNGVLAGDSGNIYIADFGNNRIRKVNSSGIISTVAGNGVGSYSGDGGAATSAEIGAPAGITMDISGNIYIAEWSQRIRKVNTSGIISTVAGNGTMGYNGDGIAATSAQLFNPFSVAVDSSGNIYIADYSNSRIRKVVNSVGYYAYAWSPNGGTNLVASNLSAGTYTITATDNDGCTATASAIITQPNVLNVSATSTDNVSCNGGTNGSTLSNVSGGASPYTYQWNDANSQTTFMATGLAAGTYTVNVTDNVGCSGNAITIITQPNELSVLPNLIHNINCNGYSDGIASLTVNGGTSPYSYLWNDANSQTTISATGLIAGTYFFTVQDSCEAVVTVSITITQPPTIAIAADSINVTGTCNGSAWAIVSGGTPSYSYLWTGGSTTDTISNQCAGDYCASVIDANGCKDSVCVTIEISTGTNEVKGESEKVKVYPNPNNGFFTIQCSGVSGQSSVEIYNVLSEQVYNAMLNQVQHDNKIDLSPQPNGIYFYRVLTQTGNLVGEGKVVIER